MNFTQSFFPERGWLSSSLWPIAIALVFVSAQVAIGSASSDSPFVVLGKLESASIKYQGIGKNTGAQYKGTARIKVLEVLRDERPKKGSLAKAEPEHLVLCVEEQHRKPTWETKEGQSFIFVLEAIAGTSQFRVLDVGSSDAARVRRIKEASQLGIEELQKILHLSVIE